MPIQAANPTDANLGTDSNTTVQAAAAVTTGVAGAGQTGIAGISESQYRQYIESKKEKSEPKSEPRNMFEVIQREIAKQEAEDQGGSSSVQVPAKYSNNVPEDRIITPEGGIAPTKALENIIQVETTGKTTSGEEITIVAPLSKFNQEVKEQILTPELVKYYNTTQIQAANSKDLAPLDQPYNPYSHGTTREIPVSERPGVQETIYKVYDDTGKKVTIPKTAEQTYQEEQYTTTLDRMVPEVMGFKIIDLNDVQTFVDTYVKDPVGRFDPVFPYLNTEIVKIAQPGLDFTTSDLTTPGERIEQFNKYDNSGDERAITSAKTSAELALTFIPIGGGIFGGTIVRGGEILIEKLASTIVGKAITNTAKTSGFHLLKSTVATGGQLAGFGTLASIGGETPISEKTSETSSTLKDFSTNLISNSKSIPELVASHSISAGAGIIGGTMDMVGGLSSAIKGIGVLTKQILSGGGVNTGNTLATGFQNMVSGLKTWISDIPKNPSYAIGEMVGFSWAYTKIGKTVPKTIETVGKTTGVIDTRIVDTGNIVASQNPLLSAAIDSGAVSSGGMLRLDTTPRVSLQGTHIQLFDNVGSKITVKTDSGTKIASIGSTNPLSKAGEMDIQRLQPEYQTYAQQKGVPFTYGTASTKSGAGTVLGLLDQTPNYITSVSKSFALNSLLPIQYTPRGGTVLKYNMADPVTIQGKSTSSAISYQPGMMSKYYEIATGKPFDTNIFSTINGNREGFTPTITPKRASAAEMWRAQYEREHAWTTPTGTNPVFEKTSFGGYTSNGMKIRQLGSEKSFSQTLAENRAANLKIIKNPAVRTPTKELNLRKAQADVIELYGRDIAFRLSETVGKPRNVADITAHGSTHVETVEKIAQTLKGKQPATYNKISEQEIYYASILHDAAKNTAYESVPGGHGEMVGSVIRSQSSLDARKYMNQEAIREFNAILGPDGVARYNAFLEGWEKFTPKQKINVANAISQHTTNLKGAIGQTHRITSNKLGRLISDADRIDLRRFSENPDNFIPNRSKMFAPRSVVESTIHDVFGTSAARTQINQRTKNPVPSPSSKTSNKNTYTPKTEPRPYPGYEYIKKPGSTPSLYIPSGTAYRDTYTAKTETRPYSGSEYNKKSEYNPSVYPSSSSYKGTYTPKTETGPYSGSEYNKKSEYNPSIYSSRSSYNPPKTQPRQYVGTEKINPPYIPTKKKRDDEYNDLKLRYKPLRRETLHHLSIIDPAEAINIGSFTGSRKRPERIINTKDILFEVSGNLRTTKPRKR